MIESISKQPLTTLVGKQVRADPSPSAGRVENPLAREIIDSNTHTRLYMYPVRLLDFSMGDQKLNHNMATGYINNLKAGLSLVLVHKISTIAQIIVAD